MLSKYLEILTQNWFNSSFFMPILKSSICAIKKCRDTTAKWVGKQRLAKLILYKPFLLLLYKMVSFQAEDQPFGTNI